MRLLRIAILTLLLLNMTSAGASPECTCDDEDSPAICISKNSSTGAALKRPITLQMQRGSGEQLWAELTRLTDREIVYLPPKQDDPINLDVKKARLWDVLEALSDSGTLRIDGQDFSKLRAIHKALAPGEKVSICIDSVAVQQVARELAGLSGRPIKIISGNAETIVRLSAKGLSLDDILSRVSAQTSVRFSTK